ncbi:MAG: hypothetical protein COV59_04360 [Candidatus Magasanikbacteria bacterium CG11_big_fil_rev_8_21_14_0_20_39_34]|uniref:Response regulatory domain-containing protein n=1 Tax=Candidatus Magasanikbacteria bacterium CG11_big_fil_rev_8_21_14_0_20_39_34 TaxID=1974653 RepID=A0A2H0N4R0_9BACT|nr:MAG: hypothetical protein COV59_04360 [Candidatus Magasanikbacteria bacterium CG11_big_fil_rev_8_21_14_0_20_39_34]
MKSILVIDDEALVARAASRILKLSGFTVICTDNGADGVRLAQETAFGLILCDVQMTGMNGVQVVCNLREAGNNTPIAFITGGTGPLAGQVHSLLEQGAVCALLDKPFGVDSLTELVTRLLSER